MSDSDFALLMAFNETFDFIISAFSIFLSIIFAFLVATSLLANRLNRLLAGIAVGLFTGACAIFTAMVFNVGLSVGDIASVIKESVERGDSNLGWLNFVEINAPLSMVAWLFGSIMVLGYIASIVFFVNRRQIGPAS